MSANLDTQENMFNGAGQVLRDAGIKQSIDHAEQVSPGWSERAFVSLQTYVNQLHGMGKESFMAEDVRAWAHARGLELPPTPRAWGGVIRRAALSGIINKIGTASVKNKAAHCANAAVWKSASN